MTVKMLVLGNLAGQKQKYTKKHVKFCISVVKKSMTTTSTYIKRLKLLISPNCCMYYQITLKGLLLLLKKPT